MYLNQNMAMAGGMGMGGMGAMGGMAGLNIMGLAGGGGMFNNMFMYHGNPIGLQSRLD